jgi:hypothetical protein
VWSQIRAAHFPAGKNWITVIGNATQFTIRVDDRPDLLGRIASALWEKSASIQAFCADVEGRRGILHLIVDKVPVARKVFEATGLRAREEQVIVLTSRNWTGTLATVAAMLAKSGVTTFYGYTGPGKKRSEVNTYVRVSQVRTATKILREGIPKRSAKGKTTTHRPKAA